MRVLAAWVSRFGLIGLIVLPLAYAWNPGLVLVALFQARSWMAAPAGLDPADCTGDWSVPIDAATPYLAPFFPETRASYRVLTLPAKDGDRPLAFRIDGVAAPARYWSLHAYDAASGVVVAALADIDIGAAEGAKFSVYARPAGPGGVGPTLAFPPDIERIALVWRIYAGQGSPPRVTALDAATGAPAPCRPVFALPASVRDPTQAAARDAVFAAMLAEQRARIAAGEAAPIRFRARRAENTPLFANRHVVYAFAPLDPALGESAEITFRPPPLKPGADGRGVRYWSVCLGGVRETSTSACITDSDVAIDPDGLARFVVGPGNGAPQSGVNRLGWGWFSGPRVLIVRQLDTATPFGGGFASSFAAVPEGVAAAEGLIGDFAPTGRYRP
ncbi:MAG: hypothetical protein IPL47_17855 [Phyllobacteriaceae bacterium]|nr:hypothetical protein [Phyllobacteriaceae bacterium]